MVKSFARFSRTLAGFTIIELMVVLGVISIVMVTAFYGLSQYNNTQPLDNAQKELITTMRSVQNQVNNGVDGVSVKSIIFNPGNCSATSCFVRIITSYLAGINSTVVYLPRGVQFSVASHRAICFSNPNLTAFTASQKCVYITSGESCNGSVAGDTGNSVGYVCIAGTPSQAIAPASYTITLTQGSKQRNVILEGTGMRINRIYAQ